MENSNENKSSTSLLPLLVGAAVGGALAYWFATSNESEDGSKLSDTLSKGWEALKEKVPFIEDELNAFKDKVIDTVKSNLKAEADHSADELR